MTNTPITIAAAILVGFGVLSGTLYVNGKEDRRVERCVALQTSLIGNKELSLAIARRESDAYYQHLVLGAESIMGIALEECTR